MAEADESGNGEASSFFDEVRGCVFIDFERLAKVVMSYLLGIDGGVIRQATPQQIQQAGGVTGEDDTDYSEPADNEQRERRGNDPYQRVVNAVVELFKELARNIYEKHGPKLLEVAKDLQEMTYEKFKQVARGMHLDSKFSFGKLIVLVVFGLVWVGHELTSGTPGVLALIASFLKRFFVDYMVRAFRLAGGWEGFLSIYRKAEGVIVKATDTVGKGFVLIVLGVGIYFLASAALGK